MITYKYVQLVNDLETLKTDMSHDETPHADKLVCLIELQKSLIIEQMNIIESMVSTHKKVA